METKSVSAIPQNDVLHFEHHNELSSEEIAKAVQRHNREHDQQLDQCKSGTGTCFHWREMCRAV